MWKILPVIRDTPFVGPRPVSKELFLRYHAAMDPVLTERPRDVSEEYAASPRAAGPPWSVRNGTVTTRGVENEFAARLCEMVD